MSRRLTLGILADVQYADINDALDYSKKHLRRYRAAGESLREACKHFTNNSTKPDFYLQLGDLIDGKCKKTQIGQAESMRRMLAHFKQAGISNRQILHCSGNHEFYNFNRDELKKYLYEDRELFSDTLAFIHEINPKLVVMHVDTYDIADMSRARDHPKKQLARKILDHYHPTGDYNNVDKDTMKGLDQRFVGYTGQVSDEQLAWIDKKLTEFDEQNKLVIMCSHSQIHAEASDYRIKTNLTWNWEELLTIIHKHKCVIMYAAGHAHSGGYFKDSKGIHHVIPKAIIENAGSINDNPVGNSFGYLHFYEKHMSLEVFGRTSDSWKSRIMEYPFDLKL